MATHLHYCQTEGGFDLSFGGQRLMRHTSDAPLAAIGVGAPDVIMVRGNFDLRDALLEVVDLRHATVEAMHDGLSVLLGEDAQSAPLLTLRIVECGDSLRLEIAATDARFNRLFLKVAALPDERVWGGGEQMSYLNMRGRRFPLWTSEPGVGRDKTTELTRAMDAQGMAGGDYWTTNYPQPTYLSSRRYALHVDTTAYTLFDFRADDHHGIEVWAGGCTLEVYAADSLAGLVSVLSDRFGRQPRLPDWAIAGAIIGLKDGANSFDRLDAIVAAGTVVTGLWCEDWVGIRQTSFGRRLFWDWTWSPTRYPQLDTRIAELAQRGIRFLGYVNPYLAVDGAMYGEAAAAGYLALRQDSDQPYLVDFGEFDCGVVDFTNPAASAWFADRVIGREMLDFGLSGWMADFGEYLPTDVRLHSGLDPMLAHNAWPVLWAEVNARAIASRGKRGEAVFFMRAGWSGVQAHCPLLWAGDQSVDFTRHDGIGTTICAALSAGLVGNAYSHSDIGGYTSLMGNVRTPELLMRWAELAVFTPVMRTHEGNRPDENLQIDSSPDILAHFARQTRLHAQLAPYTRFVCDQAEATGLPVQRPLFLAFESDCACRDIQDQYLFGPDVLVAPVLVEGARTRLLYLPPHDWVHLWTGQAYRGGWVEVDAPLGAAPAFFRADSSFAALFRSLHENGGLND